MKFAIWTFIVALTIGLAGCEAGQYPMSGQACGPADPVTQMQAHDCEIPGL